MVETEKKRRGDQEPSVAEAQFMRMFVVAPQGGPLLQLSAKVCPPPGHGCVVGMNLEMEAVTLPKGGFYVLCAPYVYIEDSQSQSQSQHSDGEEEGSKNGELRETKRPLSTDQLKSYRLMRFLCKPKNVDF